MSSIDRLPVVPRDAADAYANAAGSLLAAVDEAIVTRDDFYHLVGGCQKSLVEANHRHHHWFLCSVLRLNNPELLAATLPWVYRAYRGRGFLSQYFELELTAWRAAVESTLAHELAEPILAFYDWMLAAHPDHVSVAYADTASVAARATLGAHAKAFLEAAIKGNSSAAVATVSKVACGAGGIAAAYLEVITPAMVEVGYLWETGAVTVAHEHLVSSVANRALAELYQQVAQQEAGKGSCVVTSAPNELHELGARMFADLLHLAGYRTHYLGANTPDDAVVAMADERNATVVAVSVSVPFNLMPAAELIAALRSSPATKNVHVVVGGQAFALSPGIWRTIGADFFAATAVEGVEIVSRIIE